VSLGHLRPGLVFLPEKTLTIISKRSLQRKNKILYTAILTATTLALTACGGDSNDADVSKPSLPTGLGYQQYVPVPYLVQYPLPSADYLHLNEGNGRFYRDDNPILTALSGINNVWRGTTEQWQTTAGDYTDAANGYKAGDGPNPHNAVNGKPSDYVAEGTEIVDADTWQANIQYVIDVTAERTDDQELFAFLDDIRSKSYSTIDGFGPLTEDYAANSGAYAQFEDILVTDVTENTNYKPANNDSYSTYGGQTSSTLGAMVQLAKRFRDSHASTSGPKYVFGTPRPWRMTDTGTIDFQGVDSLICVDGFSATRATATYNIDSYTSSVKIIPGLNCGRRSHSSSKEAELLYSSTTENRRKDNGYPSGHTNAGFLASMAYAYALPERFAEHLMRGSDLGENRIIAGMHSPVDVIGGRVQATMVAAYALNTQADEAKAAYDQAGEYFGTKAVDSGMSLYDYAHREVTPTSGFSYTGSGGTEYVNVDVFDNNRYSDHDAIKATYRQRLTYGLPQNGTTGLEPIVPKGAEALLKTRLPYLSDEQRRAVLATTEVDSGYPMLDETNGWGRIDLVAASDGYGAFEGDVSVTMEASNGRFSAHDWWRNDISGGGMLTKDGSGQLTLTGENSYSGGTLVYGGILEAESTTAFGSGDLYISSGEVQVDVDGTLQLAGNLTLDDEAQLVINMDADDSQIAGADTVYIDGAQLVLSFASAPSAGDELTLINGTQVVGEFASVDAGDYSATLKYTTDSVIAVID
jgi:autotransporter-associated beta strand protein